MKNVFLILMFTFTLAILIAQPANWHTYRSADYAMDIAYRNGELWISSWAGVLRWNPDTGEKTQLDITQAPLSGNDVNSIFVCSNNDVWMAGRHALLHYNGDNWTSFDSSNSILDGSVVKDVVEDTNHAIWVATNAAIYKIDQGNWTVFNSTNSALTQSIIPRGLVVNPQNNDIWFYGYGGVWSYNGSIWQRYTSTNSTIPNSYIDCIAFEADGTGWFGHSDGVAKFVNNLWTNYNVLTGVDLYSVQNIYVDSWQRVWIVSYTDLICKDQDLFQCYPRSYFADYSVSFDKLILDPQQRIWIVFYDSYSPNSLVQFDGVNFSKHPISEMPLPSSYIQDIFKGYDNKLWICTADGEGIGGFMSIDGEVIENFGMYNTGMICDHAWALAQDSQLNTWVGTCLDLLRIGTGESQHYNQSQVGIPCYHIKTICPIGDGVWIGGDGGVSRYQNGTWSILTNAEAGMNLAETKIIEQDPEGGIWIGGYAGVCHYFDGVFTSYPELAGAYDFAFAPDGSVWIAHGELSHLQNDILTQFDNTNSALQNNNAASVTIDNSQAIWIGTSGPSAELFKLFDDMWFTYNSSNSLLSGRTINTIYVDVNNTKWIGEQNMLLFNEYGIPTSTLELLIPPARAVANYPNPFLSSTTIRFVKDSPSPLAINIYNLRGQKLRTYTVSSAIRGEQEIIWDGRDSRGLSCAAGIYLIQVQDGAGSRVLKTVKLAR